MNKNNIFNIIAVILCTIIGAGFASGRELYTFFARFGLYGVIGTTISAILFGLVIYCALKIVNKFRIKNNDEFIKEIHASKVFLNMINVFLIVSFYIMIAGFSAFFKQEYHISVILTSTILCFILYLILSQRVECILKINTVLAPVLFVIITYIGIKYGLQNLSLYNGNRIIEAIISSILYTSYNSLILIPILITLSSYIKTNKQIYVISILSSIVFFILAIMMFITLNTKGINMNNIDLPILAVIKDEKEKIICAIGIEIAIFTSAIATGYGFINNTKNSSMIKNKHIIRIICLSGIPISALGFRNLVSILYPIFGAIGVIQIVLIFRKSIEKI
mgnify:CR=1 FL=1